MVYDGLDCQPSVCPRISSGVGTRQRRDEGMAMSQLQFDRPRALSRRRFLVLSSVALGTGGPLPAVQPAAPPPAPPAAAPATVAPVTTGASPLKGTKLTIIGGNSY